MTVAVDIQTGKVIGQYLGESACEMMSSTPRPLVLLTKDGYCDVPAASVRLEKV